MLKHALSIVAFMVVSFAVQGLSHFVINKAHFDAIGFPRPDPLIPLGLLVMIIQGLILSIALATWRPKMVTLKDGLAVSMTFGIFLVSYIAIVEPSKYIVPSIQSWLMVEGLAGLIQFGLYGVLLGLIHKRLGQNKPAKPLISNTRTSSFLCFMRAICRRLV